MLLVRCVVGVSKIVVGKNANLRTTEKILSAEPPNRCHVCSVQIMNRTKPATFFSEQGRQIPASWENKKPSGEKCQPQNHRENIFYRTTEQVPLRYHGTVVTLGTVSSRFCTSKRKMIHSFNETFCLFLDRDGNNVIY